MTSRSYFLVVGLILSTITMNSVYAQQSGLCSNSFNNNNRFSPAYHIVGEVQNNGTVSAKFVELSATLHDKSGQVIGTGLTFTHPLNIEPGLKAPFDMHISANLVKGGDLSMIDHYSIQASSR